MLHTSGRNRLTPSRSGVASAEFAFVMTFILVPMMIGIWEVGRATQVQQIVSNAAREGARLAGQGRTINASGSPTDIRAALAPPSNLPNVKAAVLQSLVGAGLTNLLYTDITVNFTFLDSPPGAIAGATDPYQGVKNQRFSVEVIVNYNNKVRWVNLGLVNITQLRFTAEWRMLVDDPFQVNTTIPVW